MKFINKKKNKKSSETPQFKKGFLPPESALKLMSVDLMRDFKAFVFEKNTKEVKIAAVNPKDKSLLRFAKQCFGDNVLWYQADMSDLDFVLKKMHRDFSSEILDLVSRATSNGKNGNGQTADIVDKIIEFALSEKVSDVHVEPTREGTSIRFRADGVLNEVINLPQGLHPAIIARFKILANLKIDEYRRPQDGRIEPKGFADTSLRVSTLPTLYGEKVALRVLDDSHKDLEIESLGFSEEQKQLLLKNISKPYGMIVASGPTGSGKTTSLYALLNLLPKNGINISTLEDPVEFALAGVNQVQIKANMGLTFASGLRALLRQDPDVIMVGEIRDTDTIAMASEAALTGHLVFTTMHTNDAPSALVRFLEMKVDDFVVSSVVNIVVAQRLVRCVCPHCGEKQKLDPATIKKIEERKDIVDLLKQLEISIEDISSKEFVFGKGCPHCMQTGYRGRMGIFEILKVDKKIGDLILKKAPAEKIRSEALKNGFKTMAEDGLFKIAEGKTTFEELLRVTKNI